MSGVSVYPGSPASLPFHGRALAFARVIFAVFVIAGHGALSAREAYVNNPARGLAIYKPNLLQSDASARITEYLSHTSHGTVTYILTPNGNRLTIPTRTADLLILPYPGRGELQPEAALVMLSVADSRFPQYRPILLPLKAAWGEEAKRPRKDIDEEILKRQRSQTIAQRMSNLWRSITKPTRKPAPAPEPAAPAAIPVQSAGDVSLKPKPEELQKNLKLIQDYYQTAEKLEPGSNQ